MGSFWDNTGAFPTTSSALANPARAGLPAWATPADPSSAPTVPAPTTSSASFLSDPAPAPANPASSPKSLPTDNGFPRSLAEPSKSIEKHFSVFFFLKKKKKKKFLENKKKKKKKKKK